jgi:hypothetical protein
MKCIALYQERTVTEPVVAIVFYGHRQLDLDIGSSLVKLLGGEDCRLPMRPARDIASETLLALNMISSRTFQYSEGLIGLHLQLMLKL